MKLPFTNLSTPIHSPIAITSLTRSNFVSHFEFSPSFVSGYPNAQFTKRLNIITLCSSKNKTPNFPAIRRSNPLKKSLDVDNQNIETCNSDVRKPVTPPNVSSCVSRLTVRDQAFLLLAIMASATSMAFISLIVAATSALCALRRAAISFVKLADTARLELPNTMAAIRLSTMEISDLTLELNDLKEELLEGITKPGQDVQGSEAGVRRNERVNLPCLSLQPVLCGVVRAKTVF